MPDGRYVLESADEYKARQADVRRYMKTNGEMKYKCAKCGNVVLMICGFASFNIGKECAHVYLAEDIDTVDNQRQPTSPDIGTTEQ